MVTGLAGDSSCVGCDSDGVATNARFYIPTDMRIDTNGNLWVADTGNQKIKMVTSTGEHVVSSLSSFYFIYMSTSSPS